LTIFGIGLSGLIGAGFVGESIETAPHLYLPLLTDLPFAGKIVFGQDGFVYASIALTIGIRWFLYGTRAGLILRAVGDTTYRPTRLAIRCCASALRGAVRRRLRRARRRLSAARLHAILHPE